MLLPRGPGGGVAAPIKNVSRSFAQYRTEVGLHFKLSIVRNVQKNTDIAMTFA
jgi:hypothetical protein